jgi:hypothetical protein
MKPVQNNSQSIGKTCAVILFGALAAATTIACSGSQKVAKASTKPAGQDIGPALVQSAGPVAPQLAMVAVKKIPADRPVESKLIAYKSRDYGVSFQYPWQYAYLNAKTIANGDPSLQTKSDGSDSQFTLARVEIPKGFYPDTNFDSAYFSLSLNQDLGQQECEATLGQQKEKIATENINGMDFRWTEADSGGHGSAARIRNYIAFANGTCYELETGVKTKNEKGLAREVNIEQVVSRLDSILQSVTIKSDAKTVTSDVRSASEEN